MIPVHPTAVLAAETSHIHLEHRAPRVTANRRDLFSFGGVIVAFSAAIGVGVAGIADAAPAALTPFRKVEAAYLAAVDRYNSLPVDLEQTDPDTFLSEERRWIDAYTALEEAPVEDWREFADAYRHCTCDGEMLLGAEVQLKLLADAKRLAGVA